MNKLLLLGAIIFLAGCTTDSGEKVVLWTDWTGLWMYIASVPVAYVVNYTIWRWRDGFLDEEEILFNGLIALLWPGVVVLLLGWGLIKLLAYIGDRVFTIIHWYAVDRRAEEKTKPPSTVQ